MRFEEGKTDPKPSFKQNAVLSIFKIGFLREETAIQVQTLCVLELYIFHQ